MMFTIIFNYLVSTVSSLVAGIKIILQYVLNKVNGNAKTKVQCWCKNRVREKVVVITGANSGIGYATAQDLAIKGARLYLGCRNNQAGEKTVEELRAATSNHNIHYFHLDLADFFSVKRFVSYLSEYETQVDILVNNAGVFHHPSHLTKDGFELTYQTNFLGVFLLTSLMLKNIQYSATPRIVFVSSEAHKLVTLDDLLSYKPKQVQIINSFSDHVKNYGISKLALHLFANHLVKTSKGIVVVLTDPGNVWTPIYRNSWQKWNEIMIRLQCYLFMRGPEEGAQSTIHAINTPESVTDKYVNSHLVIEDENTFDATVIGNFIAASEEQAGLNSL